MNPGILLNSLSVATGILLFAGLTGCKDLLKDPLTEKGTGNKVTVLLMDRNFIKTKLDVRLQDNETQAVFVREEVEIRFIGDDASHLLTFTGNKKTSYNTSTGFIEVGYDPNIGINHQNPIELTVIAVSLNYISAPRLLSYTAEGIKNVTIDMVRKISGKSVSTGAFDEPFDIFYDGVLHSSQLGFISGIGSSSTGTAWDYLNLYSTLANGTLLCNNLKNNILYSDFGAYYFGVSSGHSLVPPALPTKNVGLMNGDFVYTTILRTGVAECNQGLTIHVDRADGKTGTGVFDFLITFSDGKTRSGQVTCTFPSDNLIEQIYYPSSNPAVSVQLSGDTQYDMSPAVTLSSPCGATANFSATPKSNLTAYKVISLYLCSDSHIGMGLSIVGEFRKSGTTGPWTSVEFKEGISELLLEAGADYDFRVNIDAEYNAFSIPTDPAKVETFLINNQGADYTLRRLIVNSTSSYVEITVDVEFSQGVCDKIR